MSPTSTTGALLGAGLGNGGDKERLDADAGVVHLPLAHEGVGEGDLLLGKARIDHKDNAIDGERRLGNVGRDDDLAPDGPVGLVAWRRVEDALLLAGCERRDQIGKGNKGRNKWDK